MTPCCPQFGLTAKPLPYFPINLRTFQILLNDHVSRQTIDCI